MAAADATVDVSAAAGAAAGAASKAVHQQQQAGHRGGINFTTAQDACHSFMQRLHSQPKADPFAGKLFSLGPIDLFSGNLVRQFRVRQQFDVDDRLAASAGLFFDPAATKSGPFATLTYKLDPSNPKSKSRIELSTLDRRVLVRKGWEFKVRQATVGVSAEARLTLRDDSGGAGAAGGGGASPGRGSGGGGGLDGLALRPDIHLSLDHVKPLKYELIGIGLVLLLGLPLALNNKEVEAGLPLGLSALKAFGRASLKRTGYTSCKLGLGEASAVLDL